MSCVAEVNCDMVNGIDCKLKHPIVFLVTCNKTVSVSYTACVLNMTVQHACWLKTLNCWCFWKLTWYRYTGNGQHWLIPNCSAFCMILCQNECGKPFYVFLCILMLTTICICPNNVCNDSSFGRILQITVWYSPIYSICFVGILCRNFIFVVNSCMVVYLLLV